MSQPITVTSGVVSLHLSTLSESLAFSNNGTHKHPAELENAKIRPSFACEIWSKKVNRPVGLHLAGLVGFQFWWNLGVPYPFTNKHWGPWFQSQTHTHTQIWHKWKKNAFKQDTVNAPFIPLNVWKTHWTLVPLLVYVPGSSATLPDDMASLGYGRTSWISKAWTNFPVPVVKPSKFIQALQFSKSPRTKNHHRFQYNMHSPSFWQLCFTSSCVHFW